MMIEYLIVLSVGCASGYLIGSAGAKQQRRDDMQRLIDTEATARAAQGLHRKGDILTEHERAECAAGFAREVQR